MVVVEVVRDIWWCLKCIFWRWMIEIGVKNWIWRRCVIPGNKFAGHVRGMTSSDTKLRRFDFLGFAN